MQALVKYKYR